MMPILTWSVIAGVLGLAYLTLESALGIHDSYYTYADKVLWLILAPVCAIGAMIHTRARTIGAVSYGKSLVVGISTSALSAVILLGVWLLYVYVLDPQYLPIIALRADTDAAAKGYSDIQRAQIIEFSLMLFKQPVFSIVCLLLPTVSGTITSAIAAFGTKRAS